MEEKIIELFEEIKNSSENREYQITKLRLLIYVFVANLCNLIKENKLDEKNIVVKYKNTLKYIYYNFNSLYELNKKYEKSFNEEEILSTYIDRVDKDLEEVKILNYLINLIGVNFFDNNELKIENCPSVKNQAMLKLTK